MSIGSASLKGRETAVATGGGLRDLVQLCKPRISAMVLVSVALSMFVASSGQPHYLTLLNTLIGTLLVAASSSAWNQWIEAELDRKMSRTVDRPLPSGRLGALEVIAFGTFTLISGTSYLLMTVHWQATAWAIATWLVYVCIYTPLKTRSYHNTTVGAISGALPVLIGWSATGEPLDSRALGMFLVLFCWQFPHFLAIAWIYRKQYAEAGMKMLTVTEPTGRDAGIWAMLGAILTMLFSFLPLLYAPSVFHFSISVVLGVYLCLITLRFWSVRSEATARRLLTASIVYLPLSLASFAAHTLLH